MERAKSTSRESTYVAAVSLPEDKAWAKEILREREEFRARKELIHGEAGEESNALFQMQNMQNGYYDGK